MKNPIDAIGNELFPGDMVTVNMEDITWKIAKVVDVSPGGLSIPGGGPSKTTMGRIRIVLDMNIDVPYNSRVPRLLKIIDPAATKAISKILKN